MTPLEILREARPLVADGALPIQAIQRVVKGRRAGQSILNAVDALIDAFGRTPWRGGSRDEFLAAIDRAIKAQGG